MRAYRWILSKMKNIPGKSCRNKNVYFRFSSFFPNIMPFMRQCRIKRGRYRQATDDNIIPRMLRFACWMTKTTDTHSECVMVAAFPRKQWLNERPSLLRYTNNVYLFYFILCYFMLFYFIIFFFILCYFILFYVILWYFMLCYFILCYFILRYFILFYFILFYFILLQYPCTCFGCLLRPSSGIRKTVVAIPLAALIFFLLSVLLHVLVLILLHPVCLTSCKYVIVLRVCLDSWWSYRGFSSKIYCSGMVCHCRLLLLLHVLLLLLLHPYTSDIFLVILLTSLMLILIYSWLQLLQILLQN
jgi:hypothetical protein